MPFVRSNIQNPDASTIVIIIVTRFRDNERFRLAMAQVTKARHITGTEKIVNINPIFAVAIDTSRKNDVATRAAIISTIAPKRSGGRARLKNIHHTARANPQDPGKYAGHQCRVSREYGRYKESQQPLYYDDYNSG